MNEEMVLKTPKAIKVNLPKYKKKEMINRFSG
jgi:hypothetical protein